jgi:cation diffusion facilitator CzcD-associated flavoprotein CzcO
VQFVPQIQPRVQQLDLYQRTPPWIVPRPDRPISALEKRWFRRFPLSQKLWRWAIYWMLEARVFGFVLIRP